MKTYNRLRRGLVMLPLALVLLCMASCTEEPFEPTITGSIEGKVLDGETNNPIVNATITTNPGTEVALSDSSGNYKIANIDTGRYSIVAEKTDYQTKMIEILVKKNQTTPVNFLMNSSNKKKEGNIKFAKNFSPTNGAQDQPININLSWKAIDEENPGDSLTYTVQLFSSNTLEEEIIAENLQDTFISLQSLHYNQMYYWQVIAQNQHEDTTHSKMMYFRTKNISENAIFFVQKIQENYEIMAYDLENSNISRLTNNNFRDWAPKLNPKTSKIAFVNDSKVKSFLYTMEPNGEHITQITDIAVDGYHNEGNAFAWDEDGGKIIFSHYQNLYEVNSNGTGLRSIATAPANRHFRECDIAPDNSKIVILTIGEKIYQSELLLMDRQGGNQEVLIDSLKGIVASPEFTIDGNAILFTHDVSGNQTLDGRMLDSRIFRLNLDSKNTTDLSINKSIGTNDLNPTYSPTGDKILFTNVVNDNSHAPSIWMMDVDGESREKIIDNARLPSWN